MSIDTTTCQWSEFWGIFPPFPTIFFEEMSEKFQSQSAGRDSNPVLSRILSGVRITNANHGIPTLRFCLMSIDNTTCQWSEFWVIFPPFPTISFEEMSEKFQSQSAGRESNPVLSGILSGVRITNANHGIATFCLCNWNNLDVKGVWLSRSEYLFEYPKYNIRSLLNFKRLMSTIVDVPHR